MNVLGSKGVWADDAAAWYLLEKRGMIGDASTEQPCLQ